MARTGILLALSLSAVAVRAQQPRLPEWHLAAAPTIALDDDGREGTEFLRIVGAWRLASGEVVVANSGSSQLRVFSEKGELRRSFGRSGSGPGEFQMMRWAWRSADTVFVYDAILRRVTTMQIGETVRVLATVTLTAKGGMEYAAIGRLDDGRWLVKTSETLHLDAPPGVHRVKAALGVVDPDGADKVKWIARSLGQAKFVHNPTGNIEQAASGPAAFSPDLLIAPAGAAVWYGDSETSELVNFQVAAIDRRQRVVLPLVAARPTKTLIAARRDEENQRFRSDNSGFTEAKFGSQLPERLPYFEALVPAMNGELWVQEYTGISAAPTRYLVLDKTGAVIARVPVPHAFRVTEIGSDYVIGIRRDDDGVETVRVYGLTRG